MSKLLERIKEDQLEARKNKDTLKATLLTTLLGEASPSGNETVTDEDVEGTARKFVKNAKESIDVKLSRGQDVSVLEQEIDILEVYLPRQFTDNELEEAVDQYLNQNDITSKKQFGQVMGYFSNNHKGLFDGKKLKDMVQSKLS